jgi:hypothetical protein
MMTTTCSTWHDARNDEGAVALPSRPSRCRRGLRPASLGIAFGVVLGLSACGTSNESYLRAEVVPLAQTELGCPGSQIATRCLDQRCYRTEATGCGHSTQYIYGDTGWVAARGAPVATMAQSPPYFPPPPGVPPTAQPGPAVPPIAQPWPAVPPTARRDDDSDKAPSRANAAKVCNPNHPKDLCVPTTYTDEELSEIYDFNARLFGRPEGLTAKGTERLQRDCPEICSKHNATHNVGQYIITYSATGTKVSCSCRMK